MIFQNFFAPGEGIPYLKAVVIRIHTVNGDLPLTGWHFPLHEADLVHLLPVLKETHGTSVIQRFFYIIVLVKFDTGCLNVFPLRSVNFFPQYGFLFDVIFVKNFSS